MEIIGAVLNPATLFYMALGVGSGICIGALPGLSATMGVALLLPLTFGMDAANGILMLLGIYVGAIYGGSISAILLRTPGTPASAATAIDGYAFTERGESGRALGISTISSFIGGVVSCIALCLISPQLAKLALKFSSPEFFMLAVFGLSIIASISGKSLAKGLISGSIGMLLATVGVDSITGYTRFTFGKVYLLGGISFIPVMIGLFAVSQVFISAESVYKKQMVNQNVTRVLPTKEDLKTMLKVAPICGAIGTIIGIIPGAGADIGAFVAYGQAKKFSRHPEKFGTGIPEAVAASEAGNNGVTGGAMIPMLTMGIPGDAVAAIMIGALTIQGLQPGPLLFTEHKDLVYTVFLGLFISNVLMLLYGMLGIRLFTKIQKVPKSVLLPVIGILCVIGSYAINNSVFDVAVMLIFGILGYFMEKVEIPASPAVLGIILGPLAESHFRRAMLMSKGNLFVFVSSPIAVFFFIMVIFTVAAPLMKRKKAV